MATGLQVINTSEIISGGYYGEWHGIAGAGFRDWTDVDLNGEVACSYFYHDSNTSNNYQSSRVDVAIKDTWSASIDPNTNVITVTTRSVLTNINRNSIRGNPVYPYYGVLRNIYVRQYSDSGVLFSRVADDLASAHSIFSGELNIGERTFQIQPRGGTSGRGSIYYRNNTTGHDATLPPSEYVDEFWMGAQFRNTLPAILPPPVLQTITQTEDICKYSVKGDFVFTIDIPSGSGTMQYYLDVATKADFSDAYRYYATSDTNTFAFYNVPLKPTKHYYYRVQLIPSNSYESKIGYGEFNSLAVIKPSEVAPKLSEADCENLTTNVPVTEWPRWSEE